MKAATLIPGIRRLVEHNGQVRAGESAVVVTDPTMTGYAELLAGELTAAGATPVVCVMPARHHDGEEPPPAVAAAMLSADVIFCPVSRSITHTRAMRAALDQGSRAILMTAYDDSVLTSPSLLLTDFAAQRDVCRRLGDTLAAARTIHVTSPGGTDLTFSVEGRGFANVLTGQPGQGELAPVPTIEVNVVPLEGTASGRIVADCSVPYLGIGLLREPIVCEVEDGFIASVEGGDQAAVLAADWAARGDKNCYNIAELGIGLNPHARPTGVMLEDEGILGTVHFGIGTSYTLGGSITAPTHYDLLVWHPVVSADDATVLRDREILV